MLEISEVTVAAATASALLQEYFEMRAAQFPGRYLTPHPDPATFTPPAGVFLLATDEEAAVGCGGVRRIAAGRHGERFEIKHLYLRPQARGRGWGRELLIALETHAVELGASELVLDTHHTLEAAGSLYATHGYLETEPYNDNPNATVWYSKRI